jgi:hypothetical protein
MAAEVWHGCFQHRRERALMLAAALIITAWGSVGLYRGLDTAEACTTPSTAFPMSAAAASRRRRFQTRGPDNQREGRPIEELGMESKWPRSLVPRAGESRRLSIERDGERVLTM